MPDTGAIPSVSETITSPDDSASTGSVSQTPISAADAAKMMQALNIPTKLRQELTQELPIPEPESIAEETPAEDDPIPEATPAVADEPTEQVTGEQEPDEEKDDEPPSEVGLTPAEAKLQKRNYKLRLRARRAEDRAAELEQKLATQVEVPPVQIMPHAGFPTAHVVTKEQLDEVEKAYSLLLEATEDNPTGWDAPDGTFIDEKQVKQNRRIAKDVLEKQIPAKLKELTEIRPKAEAEARQLLPTMYEVGSREYQVARQIWRDEPQLALLPKRDFFTAIAIHGLKAIAAAQEKAQTSRLEIPEKILKAHEQRDKVTVQKQTPPSRVTGVVKPRAEATGKVMEQVRKSGGSRASIAQGLNAFDLNSGKANGRELAPV